MHFTRHSINQEQNTLHSERRKVFTSEETQVSSIISEVYRLISNGYPIEVENRLPDAFRIMNRLENPGMIILCIF